MRETIKYINKKEQYRVLYILPIAMIITSFFHSNIIEILNGLWIGIIWNQRLISDSFQVMGVGASLFNAGLLGLFSVSLIKYLDLKPNGLIITATTLMMAFAFLGKNLFNVIPIFVGGYLYARFKEVPFKSVVVVTMLSTTIAPVISSLMYIHENIYFSMIIAIVVGIGFGFFLPAISREVVLAHHGYSLYNMGFAAGVSAMVFYGILKSIGKSFDLNLLLYKEFHYTVFTMFVVVFSLYVIIGYLENKKHFYGLGKLYQHSGKLVSDFTRIFGFPLSLMNIGILGLLGLTIIFTTKQLNGPVISGLLSLVAFGGFGKHLKNCIPIQIGVLIGSYFLAKEVDISLLVMTLFLATSLAPIAGEFGIAMGILAGVLHIFLVWNIAILHGGLNLYNNGLSAGILAMVLVPCIQLLKGEFE